jgi:transcriptional regulator with XRE-family HTH domain
MKRTSGRKPRSARPSTSLGRLIKERGLTYTGLGDRTGYSPDHINAVATGRKRPTSRFLKTMALAIGVQPSEVV